MASRRVLIHVDSDHTREQARVNLLGVVIGIIGRTLVTVGQIQKTVRSEEDASTVVPHAFVELVDQNPFAAGVKGSPISVRGQAAKRSPAASFFSS
jgi:hypothetical protein